MFCSVSWEISFCIFYHFFLEREELKTLIHILGFFFACLSKLIIIVKLLQNSFDFESTKIVCFAYVLRSRKFTTFELKTTNTTLVFRQPKTKLGRKLKVRPYFRQTQTVLKVDFGFCFYFYFFQK